MPEMTIRILTTSQKRLSQLGDITTAKKYRRLFKRLPKRSQKRVVRYGLLTANLALLTVVVAFVVQGNKPASTTVQNASALLETNEEIINPLDQLSSADIAVNIARFARLEQASAVTNKADTVNAQLTISATDEKIVAKPQVISSGLKSRRDIQTYSTVEGDSIPTIAAKFGVTSDTIRWSNGLSGDAIAVGKQILISPVNGILYKVQSGDTVEALAQKYQANQELMIAINDTEISGLPVGEYVIIPDAVQPVVRSTYTAAAPSTSSGFAWGGYSPVYGGNGYDYGYCTWWAAVRRAQIGRPIPSNLGNASTWKVLAQRAGLGVGNAPAAGAVIWTPPRDYYGHVGFVESVNSDGSVNISEMNTAGWSVVSRKTLSAAQAAGYSYIY